MRHTSSWGWSNRDSSRPLYKTFTTFHYMYICIRVSVQRLVTDPESEHEKLCLPRLVLYLQFFFNFFLSLSFSSRFFSPRITRHEDGKIGECASTREYSMSAKLYSITPPCLSASLAPFFPVAERRRGGKKIGT